MNPTLHPYVIFVKGREKAEFICRFTNKRVMNHREQPTLPEMKPKYLYCTKNPCKRALIPVNMEYLQNKVWRAIEFH